MLLAGSRANNICRAAQLPLLVSTLATCNPRLELLETEVLTLSSMKLQTELHRLSFSTESSRHRTYCAAYWVHRSLISFGSRNRAMGESAKTQETSNYKNTIGSLKRLIGRTLNDPDVQDYEKKFINASLVDVKGTVGVEVREGRLLFGFG